MGGAVFIEGNLPVIPEPPFSTNTAAEFNIWIDPVAAQEVFDAGEQGLKIQLTPLDATNQVEFDREDYQAWLDTGTPESIIAARISRLCFRSYSKRQRSQSSLGFGCSH